MKNNLSPQGRRIMESGNVKAYLVIGLGNTLLCDDAAGPLAVRRAKATLQKKFGTRVDFMENDSSGFDLLFEMAGYGKVLLIDSMLTQKQDPGTCLVFNLADLNPVPANGYVNSHGISLPALIEAGRLFGYQMPDECLILGIEVLDVTTFSLEMTEPVSAGLDSVTAKIEDTLLTWMDSENGA